MEDEVGQRKAELLEAIRDLVGPIEQVLKLIHRQQRAQRAGFLWTVIATGALAVCAAVLGFELAEMAALSRRVEHIADRVEDVSQRIDDLGNKITKQQR